MFNFKKALEIVLNDPAVEVKERRKSRDRIIAGFQEFQDFFMANGRLPENNPKEALLYRRWIGLLKRENIVDYCRPFDEFGILPPPKERQTDCSRELTEAERLQAVLNDPLFDDIAMETDLGLFDIPEYMKVRLAERKEADYVGKRRPCEDFDKYVDGFKTIQNGLKTGTHKLIKFSVKHLKVGSYFVEDGIIGYLAAFEDDGVNKHGDRDGRTRVVYENGSESDIKYKTITKNLSVTGYSVVDDSEITSDEIVDYFSVTDKDVESGTIYVLRSKSTRPEIAAIKNLYKIGFTVTSVESRIANAKNEPTYLCADVEVVATWKVYNVKSSTFEALLHKLFAPVQLQITIDGRNPKEWFVVPLKIIEEAVNAIILGKPIEYNPQFQQLIYK